MWGGLAKKDVSKEFSNMTNHRGLLLRAKDFMRIDGFFLTSKYSNSDLKEY